VTKGRIRTTVTKTYAPNERLVQRYATSYSWQKEKLAAVLSQFGPLPEPGQEQLINCLVLASNRYQFAVQPKERVTPGQQHGQLRGIEKTAQKLLRLLGINVKSGARERLFATAWLEQVGINMAGRDARLVNAELAKAHADVANSVIALLSLHKRAKAAADAATMRMKRGRGGAHHQPTSKGQLIRDAIAIYEHVKAQFPESGNKPGMRPFVRSVGTLFDVRITDRAINDV
jgi:hypothetical protein